MTTPIYSIGHSNRSLNEFVTILQDAGVKQLVDVRSAPGSRKFPHFGRIALSESLSQCGIGYLHTPALGGHRNAHPLADDSNAGWRSASFRNYADYASIDLQWRRAFKSLLMLAASTPTAYMCAEAVPWRCHRSIITDWILGMTDVPVVELLGIGRSIPAKMHEHACVSTLGGVFYPTVMETES